MSFFVAYLNGQPVAARKGSTIALVTGFVAFSDGVGFTDDSILAEQNPHPPEHQLFGDLVTDGDTFVCDGWRFYALDHGDEGVSEWYSVFGDQEPWAVQEDAEYHLKETRATL